MLGVPTVIDRVIQQAMAQVLTPIFDRGGVVSVSYGFRPGKSAHDAVKVARLLLDQGRQWVVTVDLSRYFDTVNHDMLMARVARKIDDKRVLKLIRAYLNAGIMADGVVHASGGEGTSQGSPLSPLLSNIFLDDFDQWMWQKQTRFVRYADDIRVFVRSRRAADRALAQVAKFLEGKLKLQVNQDKSSIDHAGVAELLGYGFYKTRDGYRFRLTRVTKDRFQRRLKELTSRSWSVSMEYRLSRINAFIAGWLGYFRLADAKMFYLRMDEHLRRRLRMVVWKQWKKPRTRVRKLRSLGVAAHKAYEWGNTSKSYWRISGSWVLTTSLPNALWEKAGLMSIASRAARFCRV